jgi:hypothetical protein
MIEKYSASNIRGLMKAEQPTIEVLNKIELAAKANYFYVLIPKESINHSNIIWLILNGYKIENTPAKLRTGKCNNEILINWKP